MPKSSSSIYTKYIQCSSSIGGCGAAYLDSTLYPSLRCGRQRKDVAEGKRKKKKEASAHWPYILKHRDNQLISSGRVLPQKKKINEKM